MTGLVLDSAELSFWGVICSALSVPANSPATPGVGQIVDADGNATLAVVTGKNYTDKVLPIVICEADGEAEEEPRGTGNFFVNVKVSVKSIALQDPDKTNPADDPRGADVALVKSVADALNVDNLPELLSAATPDFTVFPVGIFRDAPQAGQDVSGVWLNEFGFRIYCCASSLPA